MFKQFFIYVQRIVPQHLLSRLIGWFAELRVPWIKNLMIFAFIKIYKIDMSLAVIEDPYAYPTFNSFFIRKIKPALRPLSQENAQIVSPVDGMIAQIGYVNKNRLLQAKNFYFDLETLLGGDDVLAQLFVDGAYATFYLAPHNYHRVHMPIAGKLLKTIYVPGKLFSVNQVTSAFIPNLYSRNERLICLFATNAGPVVIVLVGAMIVGSMQTVWMQQPIRDKNLLIESFDDGIYLPKGAELGYFKMGSTVIFLAQAKKIDWLSTPNVSTAVQFGQALGQII